MTTARQRSARLACSWPVLAAAPLAIAALFGCGGGSRPAPAAPSADLSAPTPLRVSQPFFLPGEQMRWQVKMHGIVGAESVLVVGQPGEMKGHRAIIVKSRALSTGLIQLVKVVREEATTWIALDQARPIERHGDETYGDQRRVIDVHFSPGEVVYDAKRPGRPRYSWRQTIPDNQFGNDVHSILGLLRAWDPQPGVQVSFYSVTNELLRLHAVHLAGYEQVKALGGTAMAARLEIEAYQVADDGSTGPRDPGQDYTMWISTDDSRKPLLMKVPHPLGKIELVLVEYNRPQ